jgi:hypothetical protein
MRSIAIGLLVAGLAELASSAPAQVDLRWKLNPGEALTIRSRTHFALSLGVEKFSTKGALPEMVGDSSRMVRLIPERSDARGRRPVREQIVRREGVVSWPIYDLPSDTSIPNPDPAPEPTSTRH